MFKFPTTLALSIITFAAASACTQTPQTPFPVSPTSTSALTPASPVSQTTISYIHGTVQSLDRDANGQMQSLTLQIGDAQRKILLPVELIGSLNTSPAPGETIDAAIATVWHDTGGQAEAPAYYLISLRDARGQITSVQIPSGNAFVHVEGTIQSVMHDENGAITGVQLTNKDIIALQPHQGGLHEIAVGAPFAAEGPSLPAPTGGLLVSAQRINGLSLRVNLPIGGWGARPVYAEDEAYADEYGDELIPVPYEVIDIGGGGGMGGY